MLRPLQFALGMAAVPLLLASWAGFVNSRNLAPAMSSNASINRKAELLRANLQACDVVIFGSSTALNNIDSGLLGRLTGHKAMNLGYWGAAPSETLTMYRELARTCTPKVAVLPLQFYDFYAAWNSDRAMQEFFTYVRNDSPLRVVALYVSHLWPTLKDHVSRLREPPPDRETYESLAFEPGGDVLLSCGRFRYDPVRWDGYRKASTREMRTERARRELAALRELLHLARLSGTRVIVLRTPMRTVAERALGQPAYEGFWRNVERIVAEDEAKFVFVKNEGRFKDDAFADYSHLNRCGAQELTRLLAQRVAQTLAADPRAGKFSATTVE